MRDTEHTAGSARCALKGVSASLVGCVAAVAPMWAAAPGTMAGKLAGGGVNMGAALVAGAAVSGMFYILRDLRADLYGQLEEANDPEEQRRGRLDARVGPGASRPELRLLHAQVVFRHGARVPFFDLPPRAVWDEADAAAKQAATARLCGGGGLAPIRLLDMKRGELPLDSIRAHAAAVSAHDHAPPALGDHAVLRSDGSDAAPGELTVLGLEQAYGLGRRRDQRVQREAQERAELDVLRGAHRAQARHLHGLRGCGGADERVQRRQATRRADAG